MSEDIERFYMAEWSEDAGFGAMDYFVYARDYDAAQSELAALREELLRLEDEYDTLEHSNVTLKLSLADAERRNAEFVQSLSAIRVSPSKPLKHPLLADAWACGVEDALAALAQPTESGASE